MMKSHSIPCALGKTFVTCLSHLYFIPYFILPRFTLRFPRAVRWSSMTIQFHDRSQHSMTGDWTDFLLPNQDSMCGRCIRASGERKTRRKVFSRACIIHRQWHSWKKKRGGERNLKEFFQEPPFPPFCLHLSVSSLLLNNNEKLQQRGTDRLWRGGMLGASPSD